MALSNDPDADAVLGSFDHPEAANDSDAATVLASFDAPKSGKEVMGQVIRAEASKIPAGLKSLYDITLGGKSAAEADAAYKKSTTPTDPTAQALAGKVGQVMGSPYNPLTWPGRAFDAAGTLINAAADPANAMGSNPALAAKTGLPQYQPSTLPTTGGPTALGPVLSGVAQGAAGLAPLAKGTGVASDVNRGTTSPSSISNEGELPESAQSMGAAKAAPQISQASPELQQAIRETAQKSGGAVDQNALGRHLEADSLPVKVNLTAGQATQDPVQISLEQNSRLKTPELAARFNEQNKALADNVTALRDRVGPDVFSTNQVEHGDTLIKAYQDKAAEADADISSKYQALRDAAGGQFPVSAPKLFANVRSALDEQLLTDHAPKAAISTLGRLADSDSMTFQNFEALRTNLARTMRSATDGNERAAAGVIRKAMEELPLSDGSAQLKPLADAARAAARTQFQALEADPAYKAAVTENVPPDRFVQRFVTGPSATRDGVSTMKDNLSHDSTAVQTLGVATLDHLKKAAGLNEAGEGNFTQAGFNKNLEALGPRLPSLLDPKTIEDLSTLGNVAKYTQFQPRGAAVNNSNTFVAMAGEHAKSAAEGAVNVAFKGVPVGTWVRKGLQSRADSATTAAALKPGAGLEPKTQ